MILSILDTNLAKVGYKSI